MSLPPAAGTGALSAPCVCVPAVASCVVVALHPEGLRGQVLVNGLSSAFAASLLEGPAVAGPVRPDSFVSGGVPQLIVVLCIVCSKFWCSWKRKNQLPDLCYSH
jgi:hypothetical protein